MGTQKYGNTCPKSSSNVTCSTVVAHHPQPVRQRSTIYCMLGPSVFRCRAGKKSIDSKKPQPCLASCTSKLLLSLWSTYARPLDMVCWLYYIRTCIYPNTKSTTYSCYLSCLNCTVYGSACSLTAWQLDTYAPAYK